MKPRRVTKLLLQKRFNSGTETTFKIDKKLKNNLYDLGLTENQSKFYCVLIQDGEAAAPEISRKAGIARTEVYNIVKVLKSYHLLKEKHRKKHGKEPTDYYRADLNGLKIYTKSVLEIMDRIIDSSSKYI